MSTAGRPNASAPAESLAAVCRSAGFVRLTATPDGDALAALGQLGAALRAADVGFQASVSRVPRDSGTEADATVVLGAEAPDAALSVTTEPLASTAYDAARELGATPDPVLALAGAVAGGFVPGADLPLYDEAESALDRRPGVALPVADLADGLAHTGLVHADFSGDEGVATAAVADLDLPAELGDGDHRRLASLVALRAVRDAPDRAADRVERALRPYTGGPFRTLGGYADVLDACARVAPGVGTALALEAARADGEPAHTGAALDAWRDHGAAAHTAVRDGDPARHSGLGVVRAGEGAPLGTVARLAHGYRSPEPLVLAVGGGAAALYGERAAEAARAAGAATDATATGRGRTGYVDDIDAETAEKEVRAAI
ncbi:hypothetical protein [Halosegnis marinus]|uniref:Exonuclease RecJ n=1 Tax=Halosegnis marinus TaxID=3034023 RepID=A0ABD5ZRT9_9EURY|nr:hypothetical protein [Halosegnis sp. DT85]